MTLSPQPLNIMLDANSTLATVNIRPRPRRVPAQTAAAGISPARPLVPPGTASTAFRGLRSALG